MQASWSTFSTTFTSMPSGTGMDSEAEARGFLSEHRSVPVLRAYTEDLDRDWRGLAQFATRPL